MSTRRIQLDWSDARSSRPCDLSAVVCVLCVFGAVALLLRGQRYSHGTDTFGRSSVRDGGKRHVSRHEALSYASQRLWLLDTTDKRRPGESRCRSVVILRTYGVISWPYAHPGQHPSALRLISTEDRGPDRAT
jgi:hypothetical protein